MRKYCRDLNIPLPDQGHWSRIKFGKPVTKIPLPPAPAIETCEPESAKYSPEPEKPAVLAPKPPILFPGENELSFKVPDRLINPDQLIIAAEKGLKRARWSKKDMATTDEHQIAIRVSEAHIGRALRFMDTLIKCWRRRGYKISTQYRTSYVHIREVQDRFSLRETSKKLPKKGEYDRQELEPTGILAFRIDWYSGREWKDGSLPLEDQVLAILNHMELSARRLERSWAEQAAKRQAAEAIQNQRALILKKQIANEQAFTMLVNDAERWKQLKVLDDYLAALSASQQHTPAFLEWLKWAKLQRTTADPLLNFNLSREIIEE